MKIKELIAQLQDYDEELEVEIEHDLDFYTVCGVYKTYYGKVAIERGV